MILLNQEEMFNVNGGAASKGTFAVIIGGLASFLIGLIGGFFQTKACKIR